MRPACYTQQEIAGAVGCSTGEVSAITSETADLPNLTKSDLAAAEHLTDFNVPIYNVWTWTGKSTDHDHPGYTEPTIVDNLLYLYTKPFDIVVDPFAGSGTTRDICRKRYRRYWVSDRHVEPAPPPARYGPDFPRPTIC